MEQPSLPKGADPREGGVAQATTTISNAIKPYFIRQRITTPHFGIIPSGKYRLSQTQMFISG
jgi:hypothetical protein